MSNPLPRVEEFLATLKAEGRSSPLDWQRFHRFLEKRKQPGRSDPPVPLILAASGASGATKHQRLGDQLYWAQENGCLDDALVSLSAIDADAWNCCSAEKWNRDHYPS